jgi:prolyl-tRNA synthetase
MKWSNCFLKTQRQVNEDCISYELLVKAGLVNKLSAGIFNYHSILLRSIRKLEDLIRKELNSIGYEEMLMAQVHTRKIWDESGRWDKMGESLLKFKTRNNQDFCLAGTHEEAVVDYVRSNLTSYKDLDIKLYQIQSKFRDELRTKFGLIRGKEFIMKDAYSFALDRETVTIHYHEMVDAYKRIFDRLEIEYIVVEADAGAIGGHKTHEFQMISNIGDDHLFFCQDCSAYGNKEIMKEETQCHKCQSTNLTWKKGIELGHCFLLGTEYSEKMELKIADKSGHFNFIQMSCHGIGVSRIVQAIFEQLHDQYGLIWAKELSAYQVHLVNIGKNAEILEYTKNIYYKLKAKGIEVFWDDRDESAGVKLNDMDKLGFTYQVIICEKTMNQEKYEFCLRKDKKTKHFLSESELLEKLIG